MIEVSWTSDFPSEWEQLLAGDPAATFFQSPVWMRAVARAYPDGRPLVAVAREGGKVVGLLPALERRHLGLRQVLAMPFGAFGGPVVAREADPDTARALLLAFRARTLGRRIIRWEISLFDPPPAERDAVAPGRELRTHVIDLRAGADDLWNRRYDRNTRNCVRMAERAGVTVQEERGAEAVDVLYAMYARQAAAWVGGAYADRRALGEIVDEVGDAARLYVARREGRPLVACLCLERAGGDIHPWVSGGVDEARRTRASHLLYHRAIADAAGRGIPLWHFGASMGNERIEFFKESLGAVPRSVFRARHVAGWWLRVKPGAS